MKSDNVSEIRKSVAAIPTVHKASHSFRGATPKPKPANTKSFTVAKSRSRALRERNDRQILRIQQRCDASELNSQNRQTLPNAQLPTADSRQCRPSYAATRHTGALDANFRGLVTRRQQHRAKRPANLAELAQRVHDLATEVARLPKFKSAQERSHKHQPNNRWVMNRTIECKCMQKAKSKSKSKCVGGEEVAIEAARLPKTKHPRNSQTNLSHSAGGSSGRLSNVDVPRKRRESAKKVVM